MLRVPRRLRVRAGSVSRPLPRDFTLKVVGVTFVDGYPENLHRLAHQFNQLVKRGDGPQFAGWGEHDAEPITALLIRNPANAYDPNAIEVHIPATGEMIGHVPREIAARLAPELDNGARFRVGVGSVLVVRGKESNPGITIVVQRVEDKEFSPPIGRHPVSDDW